MASLSSRPPQMPPASGPATPRGTDWGRTGERGSAFRGMGRGRGGRGGDRARGGRGGGRSTGSGRNSRGAGAAPESGGGKPANPPPSARPEPAAPAKSGAPPAVQSLPGTDASAKTKPAPRRASARKVPVLNVEPASPVTDSFKAPAGAPAATPSSPRPLQRRRRSHQQKASVSSSASKQSLTVDAAAATARSSKGKTRSDPASPHFSSKDMPPHLLVERMRAVAMENRPHTPGSHLDWADDDDTLPDLDDWGVPSSTVASTGPSETSPDTAATTVSKLQLMSPILDDSLKQLPALDKAASPLISAASLSPTFVPTAGLDAKGDATPAGRGRRVSHDGTPTLSIGKNDGPKSPRSPVKPSSPQPRSPQPRSPRMQSKGMTNGHAKPPHIGVESDAHPPRLPLHPSLPPKPVTSFDTRQPKSPLRDAPPHHTLNNVHHQLPPKPIIALSPPPSATTESAPPSLVNSSHPSSGAEQPTAQPEEMPVPKLAPEPEPEPESKPVSTPTIDVVEQPDEEGPGLEASMHAPKTSASESEISSLVSQQTPPHTAPPFNPSHGRSRTLGRPPFVNGSGSALPHRMYHSGTNTPNNAAVHHARTQSSPPSSVNTRHARHASRPVITGDAISKLARTLGGAGIGIVKKEKTSSSTSVSSE
ncbi:hypothetical protein EVG20_g889 [Dentipellis fragilis]|uniref:Uncharacterized protein n=1 Tax=Dentipellis fragilis TaxID=205917 RepID=A0A4Y9ZFA4_9AGAM|nr:hypothetical protein EVG20_g889 [Dentipellis fragilis]